MNAEWILNSWWQILHHRFFNLLESPHKIKRMTKTAKPKSHAENIQQQVKIIYRKTQKWENASKVMRPA